MKVLAINGSARKSGNTYIAISAVCDILKSEGVETEIINVGTSGFSGCRACGGCANTGKCVINDGINEIVEKMREADGLIIGSPVYYSGINGTLKSFLDRAFYTSGAAFRFKPAAAVIALRRSGAADAYHTINNYFGIAEMIITPSTYWNSVHGGAIGEANEDLEGMQIMRTLGRNMAYLLKLNSESKIEQPEREPKIKFGFIH